MRESRLGLGKQEQDDFYTAEENIERRKLATEVELSEEEAKRREVRASAARGKGSAHRHDAAQGPPHSIMQSLHCSARTGGMFMLSDRILVKFTDWCTA